MSSRLARLSFALAAVAALAACARQASAVFTPDPQVLQELNTASMDPGQAKDAIARARGFLTKDLDPSYQGFFRQIILRALAVSGAPAAEIVAAADSVKPFIGHDPASVVKFNMSMAGSMLQLPDGLEYAETYARSAVDAVPAGDQWAYGRSQTLTLLGSVEIARGKHAQAIPHLQQALPGAADTATVLIALGRAYAGSGKQDVAIDAYVRALGTFPCVDTTGRAELTALYVNGRRSAKDLDALLASRCDASRRVVALDARRHEMPAPDWTLIDYDGNEVRFADIRGKVAVLDFWGSWCGPCRAELPYFQAMYERYRDKGVVFLGISWERAQTRTEAVRASRGFMERNNLDFPSVADHAGIAVNAYSVESFPTVFLIDKSGTVRYRNVGFNPDIDHILAAQIESLID